MITVITLTKPQPVDVEYRALLGHTLTCPTCRAGASCPAAARFGRAWREARS